MTGQAHWLTLAFLFGGGAIVLLLGWAASRQASAGPHAHFVTRVLICPGTGKPVEVTFVRDDRTGEYTRVARCSRFPDPERVRCEEVCASPAPAAKTS